MRGVHKEHDAAAVLGDFGERVADFLGADGVARLGRGGRVGRNYEAVLRADENVCFKKENEGIGRFVNALGQFPESVPEVLARQRFADDGAKVGNLFKARLSAGRGEETAQILSVGVRQRNGWEAFVGEWPGGGGCQNVQRRLLGRRIGSDDFESFNRAPCRRRSWRRLRCVAYRGSAARGSFHQRRPVADYRFEADPQAGRLAGAESRR